MDHRVGIVLLPALILSASCARSAPASPEPEEPSVSVTFEVSGGFAGRMQRLEVGGGGQLTLWNRNVEAGTGQMDAGALERLRSIVDSQAFRALAPRYIPKNTCCDRFSYLVRVARPDGEQSVSTLDGAEWPAPLGEAIALLNEARQHVTSPLQ